MDVLSLEWLMHDVVQTIRNPLVIATLLSSSPGEWAHGLRRDDTAVVAALCSPYSQGQTEGHVNRLKMLKRQTYGRANFDLLRCRVLYHAA
jgi:transposase